MPQGDSRTNGISDRESNSQANCENHQDIGHALAAPTAKLLGSVGQTPICRLVASTQMAVAQTVRCRRRRLARANRPQHAASKPGKPTPTIGPGTVTPLSTNAALNVGGFMPLTMSVPIRSQSFFLSLHIVKKACLLDSLRRP
jgi:hypothetical protein